MTNFLLWLVLLIICWPIALAVLVIYPFIWLLMLPFRLIGITVKGVFELLNWIITLPFRILKGPSSIR